MHFKMRLWKYNPKSTELCCTWRHHFSDRRMLWSEEERWLTRMHPVWQYDVNEPQDGRLTRIARLILHQTYHVMSFIRFEWSIGRAIRVGGTRSKFLGLTVSCWETNRLQTPVSINLHKHTHSGVIIFLINTWYEIKLRIYWQHNRQIKWLTLSITYLLPYLLPVSRV